MKMPAGLLVVIALIITIGSAVSCRTIRAQSSKTSVKTDSSFTKIGEELYRETITVPGDSLEYSFQLNIGPDGRIRPANFKHNSGRIRFSAIVDSLNNIKLRMDCREYQQQVQMYKTLNNSYKLLLDKQKLDTTKPVIIYRIPFYYWMLTGALAFALVALFIKHKFF